MQVGAQFRAIDSAGATIDFLLSAFRDADAAKRLFRKALAEEHRERTIPKIETKSIPNLNWPPAGNCRRNCRSGRTFFWGRVCYGAGFLRLSVAAGHSTVGPNRGRRRYPNLRFLYAVERDGGAGRTRLFSVSRKYGCLGFKKTSSNKYK